MTKEEIRNAVADYLSLIEGSVGSSVEDRERLLKSTLNRLAVAYDFSNVSFDANESEAPALDWQSIYRTAATLFPSYGYYNKAIDISVNVGQTTVGIGDAIDDLADIAADLYEVRWLWDNATAENTPVGSGFDPQGVSDQRPHRGSDDGSRHFFTMGSCWTER
jgi:hypothetical protein